MTDESDYPEPQTSMLGERDERLPVRVLHYATIVDRPNPTLALGPNVMNEPLFPVTYDTDEKLGITTIGLSYVRPNWEKIIGEAPRE
jgi:hypothetical protein